MNLVLFRGNILGGKKIKVTGTATSDMGHSKSDLI